MTTVGRGKIIFCPLGFLFCHTRQQHKTMTTGSDSDGISLFAINLKHHLTSVSSCYQYQGGRFCAKSWKWVTTKMPFMQKVHNQSEWNPYQRLQMLSKFNENRLNATRFIYSRVKIRNWLIGNVSADWWAVAVGRANRQRWWLICTRLRRCLFQRSSRATIPACSGLLSRSWAGDRGRSHLA